MSHSLITSYFEADHDRLDSLIRRFQQLRGKEMEEAKTYFRPFLKGLQRHIVWEEEVLFPLFEAEAGLPPGAGPTEVMRREHREIKAVLEKIHDKVRSADPASGREEAALLSILGAHNEKEEKIVYPAIDGRVTEEEAADLFARMEAVPAERWESACCAHDRGQLPGFSGRA